MRWLPTHDRAPLQHRRAGRLLSTPPQRHLPGSYPRTRHAGTADVGGHGRRLRQGPRNLRSKASTKSSSSMSRRRWAASAWPSARELCLAAVYDRPFDVAAEIWSGSAIWPSRCASGRARGPSSRPPQARNIPFRRLNTESLVLFGHGRKQRRIQAAETDRTGAIAEAIAQDKEMTRMLLRAVGVPTPYGRPGEGRRRRLGGGLRHRRAGGRQAARRQPGPRRGHQSYHSRASRGRLCGGAEGRRVGAGREVRPRPRLSSTGRRRPGGGGRPSRAGSSHRRRRP